MKSCANMAWNDILVFLNKMQHAKSQEILRVMKGGSVNVLHSLEVYEALKQCLEPFGAVWGVA